MVTCACVRSSPNAVNQADTMLISPFAFILPLILDAYLSVA
jgi:hypothetical protein